MQCLTPIRVRGSTLVPCGKCSICRQNYRNMWIARLNAEFYVSKYAFFITLTYNQDYEKFKEYVDINTGEVINKQYSPVRDVQLFLKKLRKIYPEKIRYFVVSEYGEKTLRPHWHMLLFLNDLELERKQFYDNVKNTWANGTVHFGDCQPASITYCTKYLLKSSRLPFGINDTKMLCSRRPAIGSGYILTRKDFAIERKNFTQLHMYGKVYALPRLFRDKFRTVLTEDDDKKLKLSLSNAIYERDKKLKDEFLHSHFEDFGEFLRWKSEQHKNLQKSNVTKHDKI